MTGPVVDRAEARTALVKTSDESSHGRLLPEADKGSAVIDCRHARTKLSDGVGLETYQTLQNVPVGQVLRLAFELANTQGTKFQQLTFKVMDRWTIQPCRWQANKAVSI